MYNKRKHIYHSKGKNQVLSRLMHGEFLGNLFALTVNGEEVYYKGSWPSISADYDQIIYIPDVFVSEIPVYRSARLDEYESCTCSGDITVYDRSKSYLKQLIIRRTQHGNANCHTN